MRNLLAISSLISVFWLWLACSSVNESKKGASTTTTAPQTTSKTAPEDGHQGGDRDKRDNVAQEESPPPDTTANSSPKEGEKTNGNSNSANGSGNANQPSNNVSINSNQSAPLITDGKKADPVRQVDYDRQITVDSIWDTQVNAVAPLGEGYSGESYGQYAENEIIKPIATPFSTFSIDVDTGSYTNSRRYLKSYKMLPPTQAVRIEEFINYFDYEYPNPKDKPFEIHYEAAPSPFKKDKILLHIGIQGKRINGDQRPPANLVFLIDVSGSMKDENKLPLLKESMKILTKALSAKDKISIVTYAGKVEGTLAPTSGDDKNKILKEIDKLSAGGSTFGSGGIVTAYEYAKEGFIKEGINRVILGTDGDFNVGITNTNDLIAMVEEKRKSGIELTTVGFGTGNYNESMMEQLANKGNGNYFYIDSLLEANKVFVKDLFGTIMTIAKDVKIQIEFNPALVASYRLIGYENRILKKEDFNNDTVDAGEIGAGHTVTAIYELTMQNYASSNGNLSKLYGKEELEGYLKQTSTAFGMEICNFRLRYKAPKADQSTLYEKALHQNEILNGKGSQNFYFAAAVAHFAQLLRKSTYAEGYTYQDVLTIMKANLGSDTFGFRKECLDLATTASTLSVNG